MMAKTIKSCRLDQKQLDRIGKTLNYFGLGGSDTETIQVALNNLENVLQGNFTVNIIDVVNSIKQQNVTLGRFKKDVRQLKRHT